MMILFHGCTGTQKSDYKKVHEMLAGMDTYITKAEIVVHGNKIVENYLVMQYFKYPDKYRLEVLGPKDKEGKITIYDGSSLWIHHPQINQTFEIRDIKELDEASMFPGHFARSLLTSEDAAFSMKKEGDINFALIKVAIPGGNNYRKYQVLYVDVKDIKPVKMEILDSTGTIVVTIYYKDFLYNTEIDEKIFAKETIG